MKLLNNTYRKAYKSLSISLLAPLIGLVFSFAVQAVEFIQFDAQSLQQVKQSLTENKASVATTKAYQKLLKKADSLLTLKNPTVMDKTIYPPSKDKHDYLSISRYWWPNPKTRDGLPWIRKDGVTNPSTQTDDVDRKRLGLMTSSVKKLALAYYFSGEEKYAQKGISILTTWFLDPDTRMNPHLQYGQSVPGNPKSRRSGILDGRVIPSHVIDAMIMFSASPSWTKAKQQQMDVWLGNYFTWLTKSQLGKQGAQQKNNHGSWYNFQVAALAWYLGDKEALNDIIEATKKSFAHQFDETGAQPHELKRTRGYFYSCFNLEALVLVAKIADKAGMSLWQHIEPSGQSLQLAIDYLMPAAKGEKWPHKSKKLDVTRLANILVEMPTANNSEYKKVMKALLAQLQSKEKLTSQQKSRLNDFALFAPQYL